MTAAGRRARRLCVPLLSVLAGCQERLTAPADCPALCPGGQPAVFDTVLTAVPGLDSSFTGYVERPSAPALLVSNGVGGTQHRAVLRFPPRDDSVEVRDTLRPYTIDSVVIGLTVAARDTAVDGLRLLLYRLPPSVDSTTTFANVEPALTDPNLVDTIAVPDTLQRGAVAAVLAGDELARVAIPLADSGVLALGVRVAPDLATGVRLGSITGGSAATFTTYVTVPLPDSAVQRSLARGAAFNSFVSPDSAPPNPDLLAVGGAPSSRALIRFPFPERLQDSAGVVRATLELIPAAPISGLPGDPAALQVRPALVDFGAKSPVSPDPQLAAGVVLPTSGSADTVRVDVTRAVQLWQSSTARPRALFLSLAPEGASFTQPVFGSTRTASPARLRVTYLATFPFENP